ncbi:hypothetical protein RQN30_00795 [Arcanobacterium hippocoleae]
MNHYRAHREYYLELPDNHFVSYPDVYSPALRALALKPFLAKNDTVINESALWLHTGFYPCHVLDKVKTARLDGRKRKGSVRRRIPAQHLQLIEGIFTTTLERTAADLLLSDLELGITAIPKIIRAGSNIQKIQNLVNSLNGIQGLSCVRSVLSQLREVPALAG